MASDSDPDVESDYRDDADSHLGSAKKTDDSTSDIAGPPTFEEKIERFIIQALREEQPYMRISAVHNAAKACLRGLGTKI